MRSGRLALLRIAAALSIGLGAAADAEVEAFRASLADGVARRHRGKGRGYPSKRYRRSANGKPHQGPRECARRVRQIARGIIAADQLARVQQ